MKKQQVWHYRAEKGISSIVAVAVLTVLCYFWLGKGKGLQAPFWAQFQQIRLALVLKRVAEATRGEKAASWAF